MMSFLLDKNPDNNKTSSVVVLVKDVDAKSVFNVEVFPAEIIGNVKAKIQDMKGYPADQQLSIFKCKRLNDDMTASGLNLKDGAMLHLTSGMEGGGSKKARADYAAMAQGFKQSLMPTGDIAADALIQQMINQADNETEQGESFKALVAKKETSDAVLANVFDDLGSSANLASRSATYAHLIPDFDQLDLRIKQLEKVKEALLITTKYRLYIHWSLVYCSPFQ